MNSSQTAPKKHRFNAVDAVIVLLILAVIGAALFLLGAGRSADGEENPALASDERMIEYQVEIRTIRNEFNDNFKVGEKMVESSQKYPLGEIVDIQVRDAVYVGVDTVNGKLVTGIYPDHSDVTLTLRTPVTLDEEKTYIAGGGFRLTVGAQIYIRLPDFAGTGYCTAIHEIDAQEAENGHE